MLRGNISNRPAPILAFNLDNLLFKDKPKKDNLLLNLVDKFLGAKFEDREIDLEFSQLLQQYWTKYDFSIYLVTNNKLLLDEINEILIKRCICFTRLECYDSIEELVDKCRYQYMYYIDLDEELLNLISTPNAITLTELKSIVR